MKILAIETSCDETSCSVVEDGVRVISGVVSSSADLHIKTGGVVPEVAARRQVESIVPVIDECVVCAGMDRSGKGIDALAVTVGPGLIGSLVVGVSAAKTLSLAWGKPLIPVNHLVGHIYSSFLDTDVASELEFPAVALIASGGHTDLVLMGGHGKLIYLGGTLDDAVGEAFDKVARMLGLQKYSGGSALSALARLNKIHQIKKRFPRPMLDRDNYDFSFAGLKTYVKNLIAQEQYSPGEVAQEFEKAVVEVLTAKTMKAASRYGAKSILLGGGVSANNLLREKSLLLAEACNTRVFVPLLHYCGDHAAPIASAAYYNYAPQPLAQITADPSLGVLD